MIAKIPSLEHFPGYAPGVRVPLMNPEGNGSSGIMLMGEALGDKEAADRLPFRPYAEAGSVLERALYRAGMRRESLTITNVVWYQPPRNFLDGAPWEAAAVESCRGFNDELVRRTRPRVIVALGGFAMRELTGLAGEKAGILNTRGFIVPALEYLRDYRLADGSPIPVIGTYHPSFLRRGSKERQEGGAKGKTESGGTQGMALLGVLIRDLLLAKEVAEKGTPEFVYDDYILGGTLAQWEAEFRFLSGHQDLPISYDFETMDSMVADESEMEIVRRDVTQVQVSHRIGQALVSDWFPELRGVLGRIIELPNPKLDWNGRKFDRPILRDMGIRCDIGEWHDGLDLWHYSQPDLPRGLQYAASFFCPECGPWKHLSGFKPYWYGCLDVDMPQRIFANLRESLRKISHPVSGISLWDGYIDQVVRLAPVLDRMTARGIPVDEEKRQALDVEFTKILERLGEECQGLVPEELKNVSPKSGYVRDPEEVIRKCPACGGKKRVRNGKKLVGCESCSGTGKLPAEEIPEGFVRRVFTAEVKCGCEWSRKGKTEPEGCERCGNTGKVTESVERWCKVLPFLPGSWQQVLKYIEFRVDGELTRLTEKNLPRFSGDWDASRKYAIAHSNWQVPKDKYGKTTTAEPELRRLNRKVEDGLIDKILEHREVDKARGTYVRGWTPRSWDEESGKVECTHRSEDCPVCHGRGWHWKMGKVHPNYGFKPATPQLSSDSPNAQNFPAHSDLAKKMKAMIVAPPEEIMVSLDWKSFFVITGGFEAQDLDFIRIGRIDMHSFVTLVGLLRLEKPEVAFGWSDAELKERLSWWRKQPKEYGEYARKSHPSGMTFGQIRDEIAKRVDFGWLNGQGARSLWYLWQETFENVAEAAKCQAALRKLFPRTDKWQTDVKLKADHDRQLLTRFGHVRRFWDVFQRKPVAENYQPRGDERVWTDRKGMRWVLKSGDDAEAVVAYLPNADAYGMKRIVLREIGERGWDEKYGLTVDIHDALKFRTKRRLLDNMLADIKPLMEAPCPYLVDPIVAPNGLWVETDVEVGQDWANWEKVGSWRKKYQESLIQ